ncbi:transcription antitermination factor NusB [bacterium]|nr:transcription antitermination factor NusB [bacterium]
MERRRESRQVALQLLFQSDANPDISVYAAREMLEAELRHGEARDFAWQLYAGTQSMRDEIDAKIQAVAANWRLSRMAATDRNVIRMGVYEMTMMSTPPPVVLDECIEIAKAYGSDKSGEFVNGILDKLIPESGHTNNASADTPVSAADAQECGREVTVE